MGQLKQVVIYTCEEVYRQLVALADASPTRASISAVGHAILVEHLLNHGGVDGLREAADKISHHARRRRGTQVHAHANGRAAAGG